MNLKIHDINIELHYSGAVFMKKMNTLIIADVHLGKIEHFRKHGSAIPPILSLKNYIELDRVINHFQPETLIFLGDLFHSTKNSDWQRFTKWVKLHHHLKFRLVIGNHDVISSREIENLGIETSTEVYLQDFKLTHHPEVTEDYFNICGHIHPGFHLKGSAKQSLKLACFYHKPQQLILPAFGAFTGKFIISPQENEHVYAIAEQNVLKIL